MSGERMFRVTVNFVTHQGTTVNRITAKLDFSTENETNVVIS